MKRTFIFVSFLALVFLACQQDPATQIPALEKALEAAYTPGKGDSLVQLYLDAVKAHPDRHADNLRYMTRASDIRFTRAKDALSAVRWLNTALKDHGAGQNLTETAGVLARVWWAYQYKSTPDLSSNPDDIDLMRVNLEKNLVWLDSSLARLDKAMGGATVSDPAKADAFIQIAEAYSILIQASKPDKYVDLCLKAAGLAKTVGKSNKAIQLYYNVAEKMPDHAKAPTALFMMAFVFENDLGDLEKAKATYKQFLQRYPNDPDYADDARNALKYLGKSPEEIIRQFEKGQAQ